MAKEYLGETAIAQLIELMKTEFAKYVKTEAAQKALAGKSAVTVDGEVVGTFDADTKADRTKDGRVRTATAVEDDNAVPLAQLNEILDDRIDSITTEKWTMTLTDGSIIEKDVMLR